MVSIARTIVTADAVRRRAAEQISPSVAGRPRWSVSHATMACEIHPLSGHQYLAVLHHPVRDGGHSYSVLTRLRTRTDPRRADRAWNRRPSWSGGGRSVAPRVTFRLPESSCRNA